MPADFSPFGFSPFWLSPFWFSPVWFSPFGFWPFWLSPLGFSPPGCGWFPFSLGGFLLPALLSPAGFSPLAGGCLADGWFSPCFSPFSPCSCLLLFALLVALLLFDLPAALLAFCLVLLAILEDFLDGVAGGRVGIDPFAGLFGGLAALLRVAAGRLIPLLLAATLLLGALFTAALLITVRGLLISLLVVALLSAVSLSLLFSRLIFFGRGLTGLLFLCRFFRRLIRRAFIGRLAVVGVFRRLAAAGSRGLIVAAVGPWPPRTSASDAGPRCPRW